MSLLVIGGARSGKSGYAQRVAEAAGRTPIFVATAEIQDAEMAARVGLHVAARDGRWRTAEAPRALAATLAEVCAHGHIVLVDCLTLWLSNIMLAGEDVEAASAALADLVPRLAGPAVFVTNEVGAGIVPENALARRFRDAQGRLNQRMAAVCGSVVQVTAGLPLQLKPRSEPDPPF